jgi:hypothetical protein
MKPIFKYTILAALTGLLASCASDTEKPVVTIHEPANNEIVEVGSEIHVDFEITDNDALKQFKIDIHGGHDGHTHGKLSAILPPFDTIIVENISGIAVDRHIHIDVPTNAWPGPYHVIVYATDQSGNEGKAEADITIRNSIDVLAPVVTITSPSDGATLNNPFTVTATITDKLSDNITDGEIRMIEVKLVKGNQEVSLGKFDEVSNFNNAFNQANGQFSRSFNLPSGISSGTWELEIEAYDSYFNHSHAHIDVIIP